MYLFICYIYYIIYMMYITNILYKNIYVNVSIIYRYRYR